MFILPSLSSVKNDELLPIKVFQRILPSGETFATKASAPYLLSGTNAFMGFPHEALLLPEM